MIFPAFFYSFDAEGDVSLFHLVRRLSIVFGISYAFILIVTHIVGEENVASTSPFILALYQLLVLFIVSF